MTKTSTWKEISINDLGKVVTGKTPSTSNSAYFDGDIPFVTPTDMDDRRSISKTERYLTEQGAEVVKGSRIPAGAVMVSCIGSQMGKAAIAGKPCVTNQQINSIVVSPEYSELFVYYSLSLRGDEIRSIGSGSAVPILNKTDFSNLPISVPPLPEQRAIAGTLGALDDKIEHNRRMNATLESMTRAVFRKWFVEGEANVLEEKPLDEIADFLNGLALQKYPPEGEEYLPVIKIAQLRKNDTEGADKASTNIPLEYIVEDGDILFSWSGSLEVIIWCGGKGALNQHLFKVTSDKYPKWFYFFWTKYHLPEFQEIAAGKATTMGHIQRHHLSAAKVLVPSDEELQEMDKIMSPLLEKIINNNLESRTLASLRDGLLPKLMRGEVKVSDVEGKV
jgi:type I restriction enzyme S subunit